MARQNLPARHYLRIYRIKLGMAEAGTTHPSAEGVRFFRELVAGLTNLDPDTPVQLETSNEEAVFTVATTGAVLARLRIGDV